MHVGLLSYGPSKWLKKETKKQRIDELRWQSMDPTFLLSEVIVEAEAVEMEANKALRSGSALQNTTL